jgi:hypothetical protein
MTGPVPSPAGQGYEMVVRAWDLTSQAREVAKGSGAIRIRQSRPRHMYSRNEEAPPFHSLSTGYSPVAPLGGRCLLLSVLSTDVCVIPVTRHFTLISSALATFWRMKWSTSKAPCAVLDI